MASDDNIDEEANRLLRRMGLSRRNLLKATSSTLVVGLAGCGGDTGQDTTTTTGTTTTTTTTDDMDGDDTTTTTTTTEGPPERVDATWLNGSGRVPTNVHFNPFNPTNISTGPIRAMNDRMLRLNLRTGEAVNSTLVPEIEFSNNNSRITAQVHEEANWTNGEPVTARDLEVYFRIQRFLEASYWENIDSMSSDGKTLTVELSEQVNPSIFQFSMFDDRLNVNRFDFEDWLERLQDAEGDEQAVDSTVAELTEWRYEEPISNGPWKLDRRTQQSSFLVPHDGHPNADKINFTTVESRFMPNSQAQTQAWLNGDLDGALGPSGVSQETAAQLPAHYTHDLLPFSQGPGVYFSFRNKWFQDARVRRAIAHVFELGKVADAVSGVSGGPTKVVGFSTGARRWAGQEMWDKLIDYGGHNTSRAANLLKDAGFEKSGGTWMTPEGEKFTFPLDTVAWWTTTMNVLKTNLNDFGIKDTEILSAPAPQYFGGKLPDQQIEGLATSRAGHGNPYPYFAFSRDIWGGWMDAQTFWAMPEEFEVPSEVGNLDSQTETFKTGEKLTELSASGPDRAQELIREFMWAINSQMLVMGPVWTGTKPITFATDDWNVPALGPDGDPDMSVWMPGDWIWRSDQVITHK